MRVGFPARGIFLVAAAHDRALSDVFQDCGCAAAVRVQLVFRPRVVPWITGFIDPGILSLDAYKAAVAGSYTLPISCTGVVGSAGRDDVKRSVPAQAKLCERSWEIRTAADEQGETRHIPIFWPGSVVTHHTSDGADLRAAAVRPQSIGPAQSLVAAVLELNADLHTLAIGETDAAPFSRIDLPYAAG
jgi:hypothetical protein